MVILLIGSPSWAVYVPGPNLPTMVVTIDIKNTNLSRVSVFSGGSRGGGGKASGNGGGILEDMDSVISLSYKQRLIGFLLCILIGAAIVGLSYISVYTGRIRWFVIFFSFGNIVALCSTMFLMGPINQLKRMFHPVRIVATLVFLSSIALAIYFGWKGKLVLSVIFGVVEVFALFWYAISYIPYARDIVCKCIGF